MNLSKSHWFLLPCVPGKQIKSQDDSCIEMSSRPQRFVLRPLDVDPLVVEILPKLIKCAKPIIALAGQHGDDRTICWRTEDHPHRVATVTKGRHHPIREANIAAGHGLFGRTSKRLQLKYAPAAGTVGV